MFTTEREELAANLFKELGYDYQQLPKGEFVDVSQKKYQLLTDNGEWRNILKIVRKDDAFKNELIIESDILDCSDEHKVLTKNKLNNSIEFKKNKRHRQYLSSAT